MDSMEEEAAQSLLGFSQQPLHPNDENEQVSKSLPSETCWPVDVVSALPDASKPAPEAVESSPRRRTSGRKRSQKINFDDDVAEGSLEKQGKRSSSRKTDTLELPVDSVPQPDEELLSKLPQTPATNYYEEESSWRFHNPAFTDNSSQQLTVVRDESLIPSMVQAVSSEELQPLPPPPPLPQFPDTGFCQWKFDETSRVMHAKFIPFQEQKLFGKIMVNPEDERFLLRMMERDDITVISEGLADEISASLWSREYITGCIGSEYHHKFRAFQKKSRTVTSDDSTSEIEYYEEQSGWYSMKVASYFEYLEKRRYVQSKRADESDSVDESDTLFRFIDSNGGEHCINVEEVSLYMIDVDIIKLLPKSFEDFQNNFKLSSILPGGSHCMMNAVNVNGRPFMGPNMYLTPPSSYTHFHQDGHGTVDSGHLCLSGYNEVVMLRRLPERHKCNALSLLTGCSQSSYDTLYGLPHRDNLDPTLGWPTKESIGKCKEMGYCPSIFVLKPGQMVHINKGRLHAFRKLSTSPLHEKDCHYDLRQNLQRTFGGKEQICLSIAWDWMFKGVTSDGINRELSGILECVRLNREHNLQSLAIPETALLFLAKENIAKYNAASKSEAAPLTLIQGRSFPVESSRSEPEPLTILRGILPSLKYVIQRHSAAVKTSNNWLLRKDDKQYKWAKVTVDSKPNTWQDPGTFSLDPYGAGDFFCKFCMEELSNIYMHCDGCEKLLNKDFNICSNCHMEGKYKVSYYNHPFSTKRQSVLNHTGNMENERSARCPCRNGKPCINCNFCTGCSCKCHQQFTLHFRFMGIDDELEVLSESERIVGTNQITHADETSARLIMLSCKKRSYIPSNGESKPKPRRKSKVIEKAKEKSSSQMEHLDDNVAKVPARKKARKKLQDISHPPIDFNTINIGTSLKIVVNNGSKTSIAAVEEVDISKNKLKVCYDDATGANWVDFRAVQSITSPIEGNFQRRSAFLIPDDIGPMPPSSVNDISRAFIAYTAPRGSILPMDDSVASSIGKLTCETFSDFMKKARELGEPTTEALVQLLPNLSRIRGDDVRHLYRNFADCPIVGRESLIQFSRREIDIINYYSLAGKVPREMAVLLPYRAEKDLRKLIKMINDVGLNLIEDYVEMLSGTVGILDHLETSAIQHGKKRNVSINQNLSVPVPHYKSTKKRNLRESPELTDWERENLPQWAVNKIVEWRQIVSDGDPRPIFGCNWCGPKIRNGYDGPLLVDSELCSSCKAFERKGYYSEMICNESKKTFGREGKTVWWSNAAYLKATTNEVAELHKRVTE